MEKLFGMFPWRPDKLYKMHKAMGELEKREEDAAAQDARLEESRLKMLGINPDNHNLDVPGSSLH
jgi:hypothetical protein